MRRPAYWLAAFAVLALAGCQEGKSSSSPPASAPVATQQTAQNPAPAAGTVKEIALPSGLKYQDLVVGNGPMAETGMAATVNYTGWLTDGTKFDSSLDRNQPLSFTIGAGQVIRGWEQGVVGMRVGGKRKLTVPPDLAYGERGFPGAIPPNSTLVFEVELLNVRKPQ